MEARASGRAMVLAATHRVPQVRTAHRSVDLATSERQDRTAHREQSPAHRLHHRHPARRRRIRPARSRSSSVGSKSWSRAANNPRCHRDKRPRTGRPRRASARWIDTEYGHRPTRNDAFVLGRNRRSGVSPHLGGAAALAPPYSGEAARVAVSDDNERGRRVAQAQRCHRQRLAEPLRLLRPTASRPPVSPSATTTSTGVGWHKRSGATAASEAQPR